MSELDPQLTPRASPRPPLAHVVTTTPRPSPRPKHPTPHPSANATTRTRTPPAAQTNTGDKQNTYITSSNRERSHRGRVQLNKQETLDDVDSVTSSDDSDSAMGPDELSHGTDDSTVSLEIPNEPHEVIVRGKNVRKIRLKFSSNHDHNHSLSRCNSSANFPLPHPPSMMGYLSSRPAQEHDEELPYPQQEMACSDPLDNRCLPPIGSRGEIQLQESHAFSFAKPDKAKWDEETFNESKQKLSSTSYSSLDGHGLSFEVNGPRRQTDDARVRADIQNNLQYLFHRNEALARGADELVRRNRELEFRISDLHAQNAAVEKEHDALVKKYSINVCENDELKIQLDEIGKQNTILHEQSCVQWEEKKMLEEEHIKLKASKAADQKKFNDLTDELDSTKKKKVPTATLR